MQATRKPVPVVKLPDFQALEQQIRNTLCGSWILRIEHAEDVNPASTQWQQHGDSMYCVSDAAPVMAAIRDCVARYPCHSTRLHAELPQPHTRFFICAYRPTAKNRGRLVQAARTQSEQSAASEAKLLPAAKVARTAGSSLWRTIAAAGMLIASLILIDGAMA